MRDDLLQASDDVANLRGTTASTQQFLVQGNTPEVAEISKYVENIAGKVPLVRGLEKRLDIMKGLDPLMDGILERMNEVTDNSNLRKLQADAHLGKTTAHLKHAMETLNGLGLHSGGLNMPATAPLYNSALLPPLSREDAIQNVVRNTLNKIEG